jgi:hypothetical protein
MEPAYDFDPSGIRPGVCNSAAAFCRCILPLHAAAQEDEIQDPFLAAAGSWSGIGSLREFFGARNRLRCWAHHAAEDDVARQLNERPRKTLGFETPAERFNACVASTN